VKPTVPRDVGNPDRALHPCDSDDADPQPQQLLIGSWDEAAEHTAGDADRARAVRGTPPVSSSRT